MRWTPGNAASAEAVILCMRTIGAPRPGRGAEGAGAEAAESGAAIKLGWSASTTR